MKKVKTKDEVLKILKEAGDNFVSGEEIAGRVFVTRAGVWKAIKALERDGLEIEAVTNRGYRIKPLEDRIDAGWIESELKEAGKDIRVFYYDEVDSTNNVVANLGHEYEGILLAIAGKQTKGRGRRGRDFYSPKDTGIYMSLLIRTGASLDELEGLTATAAVAVSKAIDEVVFDGKDVAKIKWVNDVYIDERKISGIITELTTNLEDTGLHNIVMGIGINVLAPNGGFPEDINKKAGSLEMVGGRLESGVRNHIIAASISNLFDYFKNRAETLSIYRAKSNLIGNYVKINNFSESTRENYARVTGISENYGLEVVYDDGRAEVLSSGEVSVVKY